MKFHLFSISALIFLSALLNTECCYCPSGKEVQRYRKQYLWLKLYGECRVDPYENLLKLLPLTNEEDKRGAEISENMPPAPLPTPKPSPKRQSKHKAEEPPRNLEAQLYKQHLFPKLQDERDDLNEDYSNRLEDNVSLDFWNNAKTLYYGQNKK